MSHKLTRRNISAIAKLDFSGLGHSQRVDVIAKALGYEAGGALMATLKSENAPALTPPEAPIRAIVAWGQCMTRNLHEDEPLTDWEGDPVEGEIHEIEFQSEAEMKAYARGVSDGDGWDGGGIFTTTYHDPDFDYWKARAQDPSLSFEDWYAIYQATKQADEELELAEVEAEAHKSVTD